MKPIFIFMLCLAIAACDSKADEYAEQQIQKDKELREATQKSKQSQQQYVDKLKQRYEKSNAEDDKK